MVKVREFLEEATKNEQKYKVQYREMATKFYALKDFPEQPFRCMQLKNKPVMTKEQCEARMSNLKHFDKCKGCPVIKNKIVKKGKKRKDEI